MSADREKAKQTINTEAMGPPQTEEQPDPKKVSGKGMRSVTRVRVLHDNVGLGIRLFKKGDVTDHPDIVALLGDERNIVEPVD